MTRHHRRRVHTTSVRTLITLALAGADGRHWYEDAHAQIIVASPQLNTTPATLAAYLALYSPRVSVLRSIRWALYYLQTGHHPRDTTRSHRLAFEHYLLTGQIRGPKTYPFSQALLGDPDAVVLDIWMSRALHVDQRDFDRPYLHAVCCSRIRHTARLLNWTPAQTQAAIWFTTCRKHGRNPSPFTLIKEIERVHPHTFTALKLIA